VARQFFGPDYPDDVKVLFRDGAADSPFELMLVSIRSCDPDACVGVLLNAPFGLKSVHQGDTVTFAIPAQPGSTLVGSRQ
jgi:hypothetical protein